MTKYLKYLFCLMIAPVFGQSKIPVDKVARRIQHTSLVFSNGIAYYKNEPYTGSSVLFWENKRINETFNWAQGLQEGKYQEFTDEGVLVTENHWKSGQKQGPYRYFFPNGAIRSEGNFYGGELDGRNIGYHPNGNIRYIKTYNKGIKTGASRTFFPNGDVEQVAWFENDVPHGTVTSYYQDSIVSHESEYRMGVRHGHFYRFHKNGCPGEESYYKDGVQDSIFRSWEEINCKLLKQGFYRKGLKEGTFIEFGFFGDTLSIQNFSNDMLDGPYKLWQDRELETTGAYSNGKPDGYWKYGLSSKYQPREGRYDEGVMVGLWKHLDVDGYLLFSNLFDENGNFKKQKFYKRRAKYKVR